METAVSPKVRVLCVDDEPKVLAGLSRALRDTCAVSTAVGAAEAMATIRSQGPFAVVVSDLQMPHMDGIEFLHWLAAESSDTVGILLTGNANMDSAIAAVNAGFVFRFMTKPTSAEQLIAAIREASVRHQLKRDQRLLLAQAIDHDVVTGLPDRRRLCADVYRLQAAEPDMPLPLVILAIDGLDRIRSTIGHAAGDIVLAAAAQRLRLAVHEPQHQLRDSLLFRVDDRFAVVWCPRSNVSPPEIAVALLRAIEDEITLGNQRVRITGRAGVAAIAPGLAAGSSEPTPLVALRHAEAACLEAASSERPRVAQFSAAVHAREDRHMRLSQLVRDPQFIERLRCVYQPLWALRDNRLWGLEALARYHDPEFGAISPGEFMPVAEEYPEAADRIGDWMLSAACRQRAAWRNLLPDEVRVSVNISATQLRAGNLPARVARCLTSASLPPNLLTVELTESAAIADFAHSHVQLRQISQSGIHVAIDDFGVGYSSLSYLAALPADGLKVDRSFISSVESSVRRIELLRGICSLGRAMTMTVVVEGVESLAMASWLPEVGCDVVQGFAISRPLAPARFADWYRAERVALAETLARNASRSPGQSTPQDRARMQATAQL